MTALQLFEDEIDLLQQMNVEMDAYLISECLHWVLDGHDKPCLSIGAFLTRQRRLLTLCKQMRAAEQKRFQAVSEKFDSLLQNRVVRIEQRAHEELRARLRDWVGYLGTLTAYKRSCDDYVDVVDTRLMIEALVERLETAPYQLDREIKKEVVSLDRNLCERWTEGEFVLHSAWQPAYPRDQYWWLYGRPQERRSA